MFPEKEIDLDASSYLNSQVTCKIFANLKSAFMFSQYLYINNLLFPYNQTYFLQQHFCITEFTGNTHENIKYDSTLLSFLSP